LLNRDADVNARDWRGQMPLHNAAARGHLWVVEALLNQNADVNARGRRGETPLDRANGAFRANGAVQGLLRERGAMTGDEIRRAQARAEAFGECLLF
jgi:ankyrin repeat protein